MEQECNSGHLEAMVERAREYLPDNIDRVADAIERFGA